MKFNQEIWPRPTHRSGHSIHCHVFFFLSLSNLDLKLLTVFADTACIYFLFTCFGVCVCVCVCVFYGHLCLCAMGLVAWNKFDLIWFDLYQSTTSAGLRSVSHKAAISRNELPLTLKRMTSSTAFKYNIKKYILSLYWNYICICFNLVFVKLLYI